MKKNAFTCILITCLIGLLTFTFYTSREKKVEKEEFASATWGEKDLTLDNLYKELVEQQIDYPEIVVSQALLETANFESYSCRERSNLFGLRRRDGSYMEFPHWTYSVAAYKKYIQKYKEVPEDYYLFLDRLGYAEDTLYNNKVKQIYFKYVKNRYSR